MCPAPVSKTQVCVDGVRVCPSSVQRSWRTHRFPKHKQLLDVRVSFPPDGISSTKLQTEFAVKAHLCDSTIL